MMTDFAGDIAVTVRRVACDLLLTPRGPQKRSLVSINRIRYRINRENVGLWERLADRIQFTSRFLTTTGAANPWSTLNLVLLLPNRQAEEVGSRCEFNCSPTSMNSVGTNLQTLKHVTERIHTTVFRWLPPNRRASANLKAAGSSSPVSTVLNRLRHVQEQHARWQVLRQEQHVQQVLGRTGQSFSGSKPRISTNHTLNIFSTVFLAQENVVGRISYRTSQVPLTDMGSARLETVQRVLVRGVAEVDGIESQASPFVQRMLSRAERVRTTLPLSRTSAQQNVKCNDVIQIHKRSSEPRTPFMTIRLVNGGTDTKSEKAGSGEDVRKRADREKERIVLDPIRTTVVGGRTEVSPCSAERDFAPVHLRPSAQTPVLPPVNLVQAPASAVGPIQWTTLNPKTSSGIETWTPADIQQLTDQVMRSLNQRLVAHRERMGRI